MFLFSSVEILVFLKITAEVPVKILSDIRQCVISTYCRKNMFPKHIFVTSEGLVIK